MSIYYADDQITLHHGKSLDVLRGMPDQSVNCCMTSPPFYGLRDYGTGTWEGGSADCDHRKKNPEVDARTSTLGPNRRGLSVDNAAYQHGKAFRDVCGKCGARRVDHQYGLEKTPVEYVETMRTLFAEVRRVLAADGTLWLNLGDSYSTRKVTRDSSHQPGFHPERFDHDTIGKSWVENRENGNVRMPADSGLPEKNLLGIPWRVAFALQDDGWILRNAIIWHKSNAMPESVTDRLSNRYEHLFLFSRSRRYWFDLDPIREPLTYPEAADGSRVSGGKNKADSLLTGSSSRRTGNTYGGNGHGFDDIRPQTGRYTDPTHSQASEGGRNPGDVWEIPTTPFPGAHFAVMPVDLARRSILAGCKPGGIVLDPFSGSGTTGLAANQLGHRYIGVDLNADYLRDSLTTPVPARVSDSG